MTAATVIAYLPRATLLPAVVVAAVVGAAPASAMPLQSSFRAPAAEHTASPPDIAGSRPGAQVIGSAVGTRKLGGLTATVEVMAAGDTPAEALRGARRMLRALDAEPGPPAAQPARTRSQQKSQDAIHDVIPMTPVYGFTWPGAIGPAGPDHPVEWHYNPAGDPTGDGGAVYRSSIDTWNQVSGSALRYGDTGTTTRCPSLFCEPDFEADGHNDVGWIDFSGFPIGETQPLAATTFAFDDEGNLIESDIVISSDFEHWTTGQEPGIDLQEALVHEFGHSLGLGHSADPESVMVPHAYSSADFPGLLFHRVPDARDVAAVQHLYPISGTPPRGPVLATPPPLQADVIAKLGQRAARGGVLDTYLQIGEFNDAGRLALVSAINQGGAAIGDGVFRARAGGLEELARAGETLSDGTVLGTAQVGPLGIDSAGNIAFSYTIAPQTFPSERQAAVFAAAAGGGPLRQLTTPGQTVGSSTLAGAGAVSVGDNGRVVFESPIDTPLSEFGGPSTGIFDVPLTGGPVRLLVAPGTTERLIGSDETATLGASDDPSSSPGGSRIAFDSDDGTFFCLFGFSFNSGICDAHTDVLHADRVDYMGPSFFAVPVPGVPQLEIDAAGGPVVNDAGDMLDVEDVEVSGGNGPINGGPFLTTGLYLHGRGTASGEGTKIIHPGDPLPGGGHLYSMWFWDQLPPWAINNDGDFAFVGSLDTDPVPAEGPVEGLYISRHGNLHLIARQGTKVSGVGTIARVLGDFGLPEDNVFGLAMNGHAQVAFGATLTDGRTVVLQTR